MSPTKDELRRIMGQFATGVTIITTRLGDELHGMTANAFTSLSLEPGLVLVCVDKATDSHDLLKQSRVFAVNILSEEQGHLANAFAHKDRQHAHRIEGFPHGFAVTGAPILEGCLAYIDCRVTAEYAGGDHTIFVGQVEDAAINQQGQPLIFFRGRYVRLGDPG